MQPDRIDVHHHLVLPSFAAAMARYGLSDVAGEPLPHWNIQRSLDVMDANGIQAAILSLSSPGVYFGDIQEARALARSCNEFAAELRDQYPNRLGMFAVLPMPFYRVCVRRSDLCPWNAQSRWDCAAWQQ